MWKITALAFFGILVAGPSFVAALCNKCNDGHACIGENTFQLCFNNEPIGQVYTCPRQGDVCTNLGPRCMPTAAGAIPACRGIQNCVCDDVSDGSFTCTSRTTFTMCYDGNYTTTRGVCPNGQLCDFGQAKLGGFPCTTKCIEDVSDSGLCDFETAVDLPDTTTSQAPTTQSTSTSTSTQSTSTSTQSTPASTQSTSTSTSTQSTPISTQSTTVTITATPPTYSPTAFCLAQGGIGRFPKPNDGTCTKYILCYTLSGNLVGIEASCPVGKYFNKLISNCQSQPPAGCI